MAQALTLTVGAWLWWFAAAEGDTRFTMGVAGPFLYLGLWLFVLAMLVLRERRLARAPDGLRTPRPWRALALGLAVGMGCVLVASSFMQAHGIGDVPDAVMIGLFLIGSVAIGAIPVVFFARDFAPRGFMPAHRTRDLLSALAPLLCPVLAMFALRSSAVAGPWNVETAPEGRAGILYYASVSLWLPVAALVAWSIDRLDGSRGGRIATGFAALTFATLAAAPFVLPAVFANVVDGRAHTSGLGHGYGNLLRYWRPFDTTSHLSVDGWFRATGAMMLAAALASAVALRSLGRGRRIAPLPLTLMVLAAQGFACTRLLPSGHPALAAWIAAAAAALLALLDAVPWRRPQPSVAEPAPAVVPRADDPRDVKLRAASA